MSYSHIKNANRIPECLGKLSKHTEDEQAS